VHNFIHMHNHLEIDDFTNKEDLKLGVDIWGSVLSPPPTTEGMQVQAKCDEIAQPVWDSVSGDTAC
jgi:hypothetical protein